MAADTVRTLWDLLSPITNIATLILALKIARQSKRVTDAIETAERIGPLVEGDPREHKDNDKRYGLLGRMVIVEGISKPVAKRLRAVLRGMGVASDLSDDVKLEEHIQRRLQQTRSVDRLAAQEALVDAPETPQAPSLDDPPHPKALRPSADRGMRWSGKGPRDK